MYYLLEFHVSMLTHSSLDLGRKSLTANIYSASFIYYSSSAFIKTQ